MRQRLSALIRLAILFIMATQPTAQGVEVKKHVVGIRPQRVFPRLKCIFMSLQIQLSPDM